MSALPIQDASGGGVPHTMTSVAPDPEKWEALHRLADLACPTTIVAMLKDTLKRLQLVAIKDFVYRDLTKLRRQASTPAVFTRSNVVIIDVSSYSGESSKRLALCLCELDIAVQSRQLTTEFARTHFLLFNLTEKTKEWALGKLVANTGCSWTCRLYRTT
ncbi:unnamed protein product [Peronospora farinosa]|uniref:Uncharacterized protein n=1 Tax=Peronospora farinosa TaxID=134698 RepID=A0ABN8C4I5_9STRA|nr:unnamed protein product [Peronospora farinosa]